MGDVFNFDGSDDDETKSFSSRSSRRSQESKKVDNDETKSFSSRSSRRSQESKKVPAEEASDSPTTKSLSSLSTLSSQNPLRSILGRTKHQRMQRKRELAAERKTNGLEKDAASSDGSSPGRRVRFSMQSSSPSSSCPLTQESATSTVSRLTEQSSSSVASSNVSSLESSKKPKSLTRKRRRKEQPSSAWLNDFQKGNDDDVEAVSASERPAKKRAIPLRAGIDLRTFQDTGNWQRLHDECLFLCSSLQSSSNKHALPAAADLAVLLSSRTDRQTLFFQNEILQTGKDSALQAVLDLMASIDNESYTRPVRDVLSTVLYFLSLDCTVSSHAAVSAQAARRLRHEFLTHAAAMQGILTLVRLDPFVAGLRDPEKSQNTPPGTTGPVVESSLQQVVIQQKAAGKSDETQEKDEDTLSVTSSLADSIVESSQSSSGTMDPTKAGRKRRQRKRLLVQQVQGLDSIPENDAPTTPERKTSSGVGVGSFSFPSQSPLVYDDSDAQSIASTDSQVIRTQQQLDRVHTRLLSSWLSPTTVAAAAHSCGRNIDERLQSLPLLALTRIITGKMEGSDQSCMDDDGEDKFASSPASEEEDRNPLLMTNRLLGTSGAIPLLSQALAETLAAVIHQLDRDDQPCHQCVNLLQERVVALTSLVDGACLLNDSNRQGFCEEGLTLEAGGYLIVGLVTVLQMLLDKNQLFDGVWGDVGLETLRALTSLTHENPLAAKELEMMKAKDDCSTGLHVLAQVLYEAVQGRNEEITNVQQKVRYDSIIFCLNSFANVVESSSASRDVFGNMDVGNMTFLPWLVQWLVGETGSFREAVVESSFGSSPCKHSERRLERHEDERLVIAGNGFVLLACLMIHGQEEEVTPNSPRQVILAELPGATVQAKLTFVKNTLKAFCNFYHYSIGDLSVAVVAPVRKLIAEMEAML